jgi:hypothetical protein
MNMGENYTYNDLIIRRTRLMSDVMEDYQENVRNFLSIVERDLSILETHPSRPTWNRSNLRSYLPNYSRFQRNMYRRNEDDRHRETININPIRRGNTNNLYNYYDEPASGGFNADEIANNYTTTFVFADDSSQNQCPITLDFFSVGQEVCRVNGCGHVFSRAAIYEWFTRHSECPVCRARPRRQEPHDNGESYNLRLTTMVALDPSANTIPDASGNSSRANDLMSNIAEGLNRALAGEFYEQELTVDFADLMALFPRRNLPNQNGNPGT